jgi:hypothetical protein
VHALAIGDQMGPGVLVFAAHQSRFNGKAHLEVGHAQMLAGKPAMFCQMRFHKGQRCLHIGRNEFCCTRLHRARAMGRTKNGMGWRGMVSKTSFITSQFISEPSA